MFNPSFSSTEIVMISVTSRTDDPGQDPITAIARFDTGQVNFTTV